MQIHTKAPKIRNEQLLMLLTPDFSSNLWGIKMLEWHYPVLKVKDQEHLFTPVAFRNKWARR